MPVYVYRCQKCGSQFEKRQSFTDAPLTECDLCRGALRKVLQPPVVVYKGSGFYSTDHRSPSGGNGRNGNGSDHDNGKEDSSKSSEEPSLSASKDAGKKDAGKKDASADK